MNKIFIVFIFGLSLLFTSCVDNNNNLLNNQNGNSNSSTAKIRTDLLTNIYNNIIINELDTLKRANDSLVFYANQFYNNTNTTNLDLFKKQYYTTYSAWQDFEVFKFGPSESQNVDFISNFSLKEEINTWPCNTRLIEADIANTTLGISENLIANTGDTRKGFAAIEYLIFAQSEDSVIFKLNANQRRKDYLLFLVKDISTRVNVVEPIWKSTYKNVFINANGIERTSSSNILYIALIEYLETVIRNKIEIPIGKRSEGVIKLDFIESPYAGNSVLYMKKNLKMLKNIYFGLNNVGYDDWLISINAKIQNEPLHNTISSRFEIFLNAVNEINEPYKNQIVSNIEVVNQAWSSGKNLLVPMKNDAVSLMGLTNTLADSDGD